VVRISLNWVKIVLISLCILLLLASTSSSWLSISAQTQTAADTVPPNTDITSAVDGNGKPVQNGGSTTSSSIRFMFRGIDSIGAVSNFQCSIDNRPYSTCASGISYPSLNIGGHSFAVVSRDPAGNIDHSPAFFTWTITEAQQSSPSNLPSTSSQPSASNPTFSIETSPSKASSQIAKRANQSPQISSLASTASCSADVCVNPGETASLNIICSNPDFRVVVTCIMLSGPPGATFSSTTGNPAEGTMTWTNAGPPGTYEASFQAICVSSPPDVTCLDSSILTLTILVNHPPVANAGPDQTVKAEDIVTLNGAGSSDTDNDPLTYSWSQIAGSPSVSLDNPSVATPTFTAPAVNEKTTLTFQLIVNDGRVDSEPDTVDVIVDGDCGCSDQTTLSASSNLKASDAGSSCKESDLNVQYSQRDSKYNVKGSSLASVKFKPEYAPEVAQTSSAPPKVRPVLDDQGLVTCGTKMSVSITKDMPDFPGIKKLSSAAQQEWNRFIQSVDMHENNHVDIIKNGYEGKGGYNGIIEQMIGKTPAEANRILTQAGLDTQAAHDLYDAATQNGKSEGATLDTGIP
jgi:hypothetical protein